MPMFPNSRPVVFIPLILTVIIVMLFVQKNIQIHLRHTSLQPFDVDDQLALVDAVVKDARLEGTAANLMLVQSRQSGNSRETPFARIFDQVTKDGKAITPGEFEEFCTAITRLLADKRLSDSTVWGLASDPQLIRRTHDFVDRPTTLAELSSSKRHYYNVLLFKERYRAHIETRAGWPRFFRLTVYGVVRKLDDGSLWVIAALLMASLFSCSAWCVRRQAGTPLPRSRTAACASIALAFVSVAAYMFVVCVLPGNRGTFCWDEPGSMHVHTVKVLQWLEGLWILVVTCLAWVLFYLMWKLLLWALHSGCNKRHAAKVCRYIFLATVAPLLLIAVAFATITLCKTLFGFVQSYPSNFSLVAFIFYFVVNYAAFLILGTISLRFAGRFSEEVKLDDELKLVNLLGQLVQGRECATGSEPTAPPPPKDGAD